MTKPYLTLLFTFFSLASFGQFTQTIEGNTVTFTATYYDCGYDTQLYNWDYGDGTTETVICNEITTHTYADNGEYEVCLNMTDSFGSNGTHCNSITIGTASGIQETSSTELSLYPNPATDALNIQLSQNKKEIIVQVFNVFGSLEFQDVFFNSNNIRLDISEYNSGIYFFSTVIDDKTTTQRFVKL